MEPVSFILGTATLPLLYFAARYVNGMMEDSSIADAVQWEALATNKLVLTKDEAFIAVWEVSGPDLSFTSPERADALGLRVQRLLDTMDGDTMLHVDSVRVESEEHKSPDGTVPPVAKLIDEKRKEKYSSGDHFENRTFLALTVQPQSSAAGSFLSDLMYTGDYNTGESYEEKLEMAQEAAREFGQYLPDPLSPTRLEGKDLVSYLHLMMTGENADVTPPPPEYPSLRYLYAHDLQSGFEPKLGDKWYSVVGIWGYPEEVSMGVSEALYGVPFPYRFSNRLIGLNKAKALSEIQSRTGKFQMEANDLLSQLSSNPNESDPNNLYKDDRAQELAFETKEVERQVQSGNSLLHHTGVVIVWDEDKDQCHEKALQIKKHLRNAEGGFIVSEEKGMATQALIGSWAGHGEPNQRRYLLLSPSASRMLPITGTYPGPTETPCTFYEDDDGEPAPPLFYSSTEESVPFRFTPFGESGDVGHQAVVGPTGSGKSIFLNFQALRQIHYEGGRSIVFDRGHSFAPLCESLDGTFYDLDEMEVGFMPLADIDDSTELSWAVTWISDICRDQGVDIDPSRRQAIRNTLERVSQQSNRTLQNFQQIMSGRDKEVADALQPFAGRGDLGNLLNSNEDNFQDGHFLVIELGSLVDLDPNIFTPVLTYLFHKIGTMLSGSRPTHLIADEFFALARKSQTGRDRIEEALRTYRKKNAFVTIGTQAPGDLIGEETEGILNSINTHIMLPNPDALSPVQREAYKEIGLNPEQIQIIAESRPKREYITIQPDGSRKFDLDLGVELAFMTEFRDLTLKETANMIVEYKSRYGSTWIHEWLKARGLSDAANDAPLDVKRKDGTGDIKFLPAPEEGSEGLQPTGGQEFLEEGDGATQAPERTVSV
jgi:type IV secretion system protein VirB4